MESISLFAAKKTHRSLDSFCEAIIVGFFNAQNEPSPLLGSLMGQAPFKCRMPRLKGDELLGDTVILIPEIDKIMRR